MWDKNLNLLLQGSQQSGKTWKTCKKGGIFRKSQGILQKSGKSQGISFQNPLKLAVFLVNLWISIFQTQPWWVLQVIMKPTKIRTADLFKTVNGIFEKSQYFFLNIADSGQGKKVRFHLDSRKDSLFFSSTFVREKG